MPEHLDRRISVPPMCDCNRWEFGKSPSFESHRTLSPETIPEKQNSIIVYTLYTRIYTNKYIYIYIYVYSKYIYIYVCIVLYISSAYRYYEQTLCLGSSHSASGVSSTGGGFLGWQQSDIPGHLVLNEAWL